MRIGILSDTHDRAAAMKAAIELLRQRGTEFFIHCGDVGSEQILDYLAGLPAAFVWANNDWDRLALSATRTTLASPATEVWPTWNSPANALPSYTGTTFV